MEQQHASHDDHQKPSTMSTAGADDARALLQHLAATVGVTPDTVAAALLRHPYLRHAVVMEIKARWGATDEPTFLTNGGV
jgi:hypothetical protein